MNELDRVSYNPRSLKTRGSIKGLTNQILFFGQEIFVGCELFWTRVEQEDRSLNKRVFWRKIGNCKTKGINTEELHEFSLLC